MPKPGFKVITINAGVFKEAQDYIDKVNREAGYKKIRNVAQFMEEAVINLAVHEIRKEAESPEDVLHKVVQIMLERDDLLKTVFKEFLEIPPEEARLKLHRLLGKKDIQAFRKLLEGGT